MADEFSRTQQAKIVADQFCVSFSIIGLIIRVKADYQGMCQHQHSSEIIKQFQTHADLKPLPLHI